MRRERRPVLRVSPAKYEHFRERVGTIASDYPEIEFIDVVEDPSLAAPQIVVESSIGRVDGNLGDRVKELAELVINAVSRSDPEGGQHGAAGQEAA
jgi:type III secretion protein L